MFVMDDVWMTTKSTWIDVSSEKTFICNDFKAVCLSTCLSQSFHRRVTCTKNMLLELIQTPLCLFETFDYFEIGMDRIDSGCKMVFFLQGLEMN